MDTLFFPLLGLLVLMVLSAFFSCSETSLFSLGRLEVQRFKRSKRKSSKYVIDALMHRREFLITILMGNELCNVSISVLLASIVYTILDTPDWKLVIIASISVTTPVLLIFCEMIPKNIAIRFAEKIAPVVVLPLRLFFKLTYPIRVPITWVLDRVFKLFRGGSAPLRMMIMEEEFRQLLDKSEEEGVVEEEEAELIHGVFGMSDHSVGDIMTPKGEVFCVSLDKPQKVILEEIKATQFSRIPVYAPRETDIAGILYVKDLLLLRKSKSEGRIQDIEDIIRPAVYVDQSINIAKMLKEFQKRKVQIAIVQNNEKEFIGVVTMSDVIDMLIGEKEDHIEKVKSEWALS